MLRRLLPVFIVWLLASVPALAAGDPPGPLPVPPLAPAATAAPAQNVTNVTNVVIPEGPTPKSFAGDFAEGISSIFFSAADSLLSGAVHALVGGQDFITQTPPALSYGNGQVLTLWNRLRVAADALLAALIAVGGLTIALRQQAGRTFLGPVELLQRAAIAAVLIQASLLIGQWAIDLSNALSGAVAGALPAWDVPVPADADLGALIGRFAYLVAALLLVAFMAVRLLLVDACLVAAPLALVCWTLPQTQVIFARWANVFVGYLFIQAPMVAVLALGQGILGTAGGGPAGLVLGIAAFVAVFKLPGIFGVGSHASGTGVAGALLLTSGVQRLAGAAGGAAAGVAGAYRGTVLAAAARGLPGTRP